MEERGTHDHSLEWKVVLENVLRLGGNIWVEVGRYDLPGKNGNATESEDFSTLSGHPHGVDAPVQYTTSLVWRRVRTDVCGTLEEGLANLIGEWLYFSAQFHAEINVDVVNKGTKVGRGGAGSARTRLDPESVPALLEAAATNALLRVGDRIRKGVFPLQNSVRVKRGFPLAGDDMWSG